MESVFEEWNTYASKKELKQRNIDFDKMEANSRIKIIALTGVRRSGKSSALMLLSQKLLSENKKAAFVNLEDSRIKNDKEVLDQVLKWFGDKGYLLLDEITSAQDWEGWLARNHELLKGKLHLFVSSSRKSLATPAKPLRGRILAYELYPLSFREFLSFKNIKHEKTTAGIGRIEKALDEYLRYGGFPEIALVDDKTEKVKIINSYFKDIIGLDVAETAKEDITAVELFGKYVIEATYFSASKCLNFFKSLGYRIGKQSILRLEKHAQMSYLFFFTPISSFSVKDKAQYPRKAYLGDTGLMYGMTGKTDMGRLYENAVFLELKRKLPANQDISYWKNSAGIETDFVIKEGLRAKEIIQVAYELGNAKTRERELKALVECAKEFKLRKGLVITKSEEGSETLKGIRIMFSPLWKWLLE